MPPKTKVVDLSLDGDEDGNDYVEVRESEVLPGEDGVFALKDIPKNTFLGNYTGKVMTRAQWDAAYGATWNGYGLDLGNGKMIDGRPPHGNWASRINAAKDTGKLPNVSISGGRVKTLKKVDEGEELLTVYGRSFWAAYKRAQKSGLL